MLLTAMTVQAQVNIQGKVFGGARQANVGGHTFVSIKAEKHDVVIDAVYGGNDIAGSIGSSTKPAGVDDDNHISNLDTYNAFVRTDPEAEGKRLFIGQLFGGGYGNYTYTESGSKYKVSWDVKEWDPAADNGNGGYPLKTVEIDQIDKPELDRTYLDLHGGTFGYVFGGGDNVTVKDVTQICINNNSTNRTKIADETGGWDLLTTSRLQKMGINTAYFNKQENHVAGADKFLFSRVFGGNNKADMDIRPNWHLQKGSIEDLYSGGNEGRMIHKDGLLLEIGKLKNDNTVDPSYIQVLNVYGGCRKSDVRPMKKNDITGVLEDVVAKNLSGYNFPDTLAARVIIRSGQIHNVYGGNDVTGRVYGGNAVGIYANVSGNVYGGGNGSYPYTDNSKFVGDLLYGDFYYDPDKVLTDNNVLLESTVTSGLKSATALNYFRPNAEQVSIRLLGTNESAKTVIRGQVYCGGNSATLKSSREHPRVELKIGSYVIADEVFLGNNGANMVTDDILGMYANQEVADADGEKWDFSQMNLANATEFATYMDGAAMDLIPKVSFDNKDRDGVVYEPYSSMIGSFYCGGNVGSMTYPGTNTMDFSVPLYVYTKIVGGCNNAFVKKGDHNADYYGGIKGAANEANYTLDGTPEGKIKDRLILNFGGSTVTSTDNEGTTTERKGIQIKPMRWNDDNTALILNTVDDKGIKTSPVLSGGENAEASPDDMKRRFDLGNIYGGCYSSGHVNGNVVINLNATIIDRDKLFDEVESDEEGEEISLYGEDQTKPTTFKITKRNTGVILAQQGMDVLGKALNVFGGGMGKETEIWGSTTINLNRGYTFQIFGGSQEGAIGKGTWDTTNKKFIYGTTPDERYSCTVNMHGTIPGDSKRRKLENGTIVENNSPNMAEAEFIYGGGFEGPIMGNAIVNLGNGRIFNSFAGSCNADIMGHTETYIGRSGKVDRNNEPILGFPWIRDYTYGGNDLGGEIKSTKDFSGRVRNNDVRSKIYRNNASSLTTANAYTEYIQGRAIGIFGGCYGTYNYKDTDKFGKYTDANGDPKEDSGFTKPHLVNAFVNFRPTTVENDKNGVDEIFGAGQGYPGEKDMNKMQDRSYVLIDVPDGIENYSSMEVFGGGAYGGVGMKEYVAPIANPTAAQENTLDQHSSIIDLINGKIGAAYGASYKEGITRRTVVNVPSGSTIEINNIFGGAYGISYLQPCDAYEANVNYNSDLATVTGAIFGGNNSERRTLYGKVNINSTVWSDKDRSKNYYGTVYGAGLGGNTWSEYTEVNLNNGATVYEVYGGGKAGKVYNAESIEHYMNYFATASASNGNIAIPASAWTIGTDYYVPTLVNNKYSGYTTSAVTNLSNPLTRTAEMEDRDYIATTDVNYKKYNTNVIINKGARVANYAYGGGLGELAKVSGTTYIALLGGTVKKDIYAAGTSGAVQDTLGTHKFIASANAYVEGGTCRNVYGGGWNGSVGMHVGGADPIFDEDGKAINAVEVIAGGFTNDVYGETHVVIGKLQENLGTAPTGEPDFLFYHGIPTIQRNAYGGGEGGPVFGCTHLTLNNGYIGYDYNAEGTDITATEDIDERYEEKIVDETNKDKDGHFIENKNLKDSGCLFGGGYIDNSSVDSTVVKMFGGHVRNAMFGGGEIAAVGRGKISASGDNNSVRSLDAIYKAGKTNIEMFGGHVHRNVFGGGRGFNNLGKQGTLFSDGFVFGQTEVHIHGGEIGTNQELAAGNGNVFGGGDIGYVYSAYEYDDNGTMKLGRGVKKGNRYDEGQEGYYYRHKGNNGTFSSQDVENFEKEGSEYIPTEDCKVLIEPWTKVTGNSSVSFEGIHYAKGHVVSTVDLKWLKKNRPTGIDLTTDLDITTGKVKAINGITFDRSYAKGEYVPTYALNTLGNKNSDSNWNSLDPTGIIIHNAVFAGGNTSSGSATVYANATSVYGNATASIHDVYHRDLITLGTGHTGGLYGDGNLTFVDGYRGLNITNYGTDYYSISEEVTIDQYKLLPAREAAYYEMKYKCLKACDDKDGTHYLPASQDGTTKASTITADDLYSLFLVYEETNKRYVSVLDGSTPILQQDEKGNWQPNPTYWTENHVLPVYAGRLMNSIQRADFCGVFGSRMVMQGAQDRVPEIVDFTNYTINRVREVSLNQQHSVIAADQGNEKNGIHGNYFGIYNIVNYLGALSSDVHFRENEDIRKTSNTSNNERFKSDITIDGNTYEYGQSGATYYNWKRAKIKENTRNNGSSLNKVALASGVYLELTTEKSTGKEINEKDWGYITGVIELDLINVQTGIGGGFVYAKNEHRLGTYEDKEHVTLTALNADAITRKNYTYTDGTEVEWETSGNFVHSTQTIIDDCYNVSGKYKGDDKVPAHYWYIKGSVYVYDQYISAYTGAPNAYSESVNIPLTITAASHGTMKLLNVMPNKYAYYSSPGVVLGTDNKVVINDVAYYKNDPISYWDWYLLSRYEKDLFVDKTYVVIDSCKIGDTPYPAGYVMLPEDYSRLATVAAKPENKHVVETGGSAVPAVQMMTKNEQNQDVPVTDSNGQPVYKAFDFVFRESNNLSHDTGYILTYKVNNPTEWNTWYTEKNDIAHDAQKPREKNQEGGSDYDDGPTYHLISETGTVLGQRKYKMGDVISKEIYDRYEGDGSQGSGVKAHVTASDGDQATFVPAYLVTTQYTTSDGHHNNPGSAVSESVSGYTAPALICTSTIQLSTTEFIYLNTKMTQSEKTAYINGINKQIRDLGIANADNPTTTEINALSAEQKKKLTSLQAIKKDIEDNIVPAYYCTIPGNYGGNYYEGGKNYRGLEAWSSMSAADRAQFEFNYDALDLLIDPTYSRAEGIKYQYDGSVADTNGDGVIGDDDVTNEAGYSIVKPVNYTAEYTGTTNLSLGEGKTVTVIGQTTPTGTLTRGNELTRIDYELLTNEQRYYVPIKVLESNKVEVTGQDPIYKVYVVSESFQVGNSPYAVGTVLSSGDYNALNDDDKAHVTQLVFPNGNYNNQTFYYCRESYTIGEHGNGVPVSNSATVTAKNSNGVDITVTRTTSSTDPVPVGLVIGESYYSQLANNNQQKNFTIHGIAPTETSTFYVSRESDIFDLSTEKIITVIYQYDYEECDENGNITPISERHVVNIHIEFKSGVPSVEDIKAPQIIIPGDYVNLREPAVTSGAYEVTGGGWELFETIGDAESHSNGIEYSPQFDPLYWYQDDWYVAYYAKTYLGKTYSNHVQVSVANYHDLKKVMEALKHHYYVDNPNVKRDPKIYINDYSGDASGSKNGLDLLKSLFDLSVLNNPSVSEETGLITSGDFTGHKPLNNIVRGGDNLDFILHTDIDHGPTTKPDPDHEGQTITENHPWSSIGSGNDCFAGTLHGDGHHLSGLDQSLFGSLCGQVYNLGVSGSFTGAGVAETGKGYVENCWVKTTGEIPANTTIKAVFGNPTDNKGTQVENCYYAESNAYSEATHDRGNARKMPDKAFYNGEVAYDLNGFYLHKRYYDGINQNSGTQYNYLLANADGTLPDNMSQGYYPSDYAIYPLDPTKPNERGYVENRFFDGDFQYSNGKIPEDPEIRMRIVKVTEGAGANAKQVDKTYYLPIWPDDYLFFGQSLNYDHVTGRTHQNVPSAINRSGERLLTTEAGNRVYRAPAYFRSSEMGVAHFNPYAVFAKSKKDVPAVEAYKGMTAIDFTGHDDVSHGYQSGKISAAPYNHVENGAFYPPLLDDGGLSGLRNADLTKNLLVYTGTSTDAAVKTDAVVSNYLDDEAYAENDATGFGYVEGKAEYRTVAYRDPHKVYGHWVQQRGNGYVATRDHLLVDKQDFFAPMAYTFVEDTEGKEHLMWYQRDPDNFVDTEKGWEGISLPFTADIVTTQTKGELTHFYEGSTTGHEYWLRLFAGNVKLKEGSTGIYTADFNVPAASGDDKNVTNTFLWDYYYKGNEHNQKDMRQDTYQTYYSSSRQYDQYPRLAVGTPYLIGFPGATYYEFDLSGTWQAATTAVDPFGVEEEQIITFASPTGITINKSDDDMEGTTKNGLTFKPNYLSESFKAGTANTFTLKADGSSYVKVPTSGGDVSVDAFRPYFTGAPSGSRTRGEAEEIIFSKSNGDFGVIDRDDPNDKAGGGLLIYAKKHKIVVESALTYATEVRIVNLAGMTINTFTIEPGETVETRINNAAVFIVQTTDGRYNKKLSVR